MRCWMGSGARVGGLAMLVAVMTGVGVVDGQPTAFGAQGGRPNIILLLAG